jgi:hypothetical protein
MDCTVTSKYSPTKGEGRLPGYVNGLIFHLNKPADVTDANAALQATWQTALDATTNRAYMLLFDDASEFGENEPIVWEATEGNENIGVKLGTDIFKLKGTSCTVRTLLTTLESGITAYAYFLTDKEVLEGKDGTATATLAAVKVRMSAYILKGTAEQPRLIALSVTPSENYFKSVRDLYLDWDPASLTPTQSVELTEVSSSTTQLVLSATYCGVCDNADLDSGKVSPATNFIILDDTGTPVVPSATSISGNQYTLTATLTAGTYTAYYDLPVTTGEPYISNTVTFTTV